jgi:hypothetical protein
MAVKGLHHLISDAPDATREWLVKWSEIPNHFWDDGGKGQSGQFIGLASVEALVGKASSLFDALPHAKGFSFEFPEVKNSILIFRDSEGRLVFSSTEI